MKLPYELIEYIYTFYNPHKDNYTKFLENLENKFFEHKYINRMIMYSKKMIYEYELKISAFGFNIMGSDILKCIFLKRKQIINEDDYMDLGLIKYWYYLLSDENYFWNPNNLHKKIDLTCPVLNRLEFGISFDTTRLINRIEFDE
jgi:hypothetical protein